MLIVKIDSLSRNVALISQLMESQVEFIAVDNPHANKFIVRIKALVAEHKRDRVSKRIKGALAVAKKRDVQLGVYGKNVLSRKNKAAPIEFAKK